MIRAYDQPRREINSLNGSTTASRKLCGGILPRNEGSGNKRVVIIPTTAKDPVIKNTASQGK